MLCLLLLLFLTTRLTRIIFTSLTSFSVYDGQCCYFTTSLLPPPPTPRPPPPIPFSHLPRPFLNTTPPSILNTGPARKVQRGVRASEARSKKQRAERKGRRKREVQGERLGPGQGGGDRSEREKVGGGGRGGEGGSFICPLNEGQVDQGRPLNTREGEKIEIVGEERVGQRPPAMPEMPNRGRTRLLLSDRGTNMDLFSLSLSLSPSLPLPPCWLHRDEGEA